MGGAWKQYSATLPSFQRFKDGLSMTDRMPVIDGRRPFTLASLMVVGRKAFFAPFLVG